MTNETTVTTAGTFAAEWLARYFPGAANVSAAFFEALIEYSDRTLAIADLLAAEGRDLEPKTVRELGRMLEDLTRELRSGRDHWYGTLEAERDQPSSPPAPEIDAEALCRRFNARVSALFPMEFAVPLIAIMREASDHAGPELEQCVAQFERAQSAMWPPRCDGGGDAGSQTESAARKVGGRDASAAGEGMEHDASGGESPRDRLETALRKARALADLVACAGAERDVRLLEGTVADAAFEIVRHLDDAEAAAEFADSKDARLVPA